MVSQRLSRPGRRALTPTKSRPPAYIAERRRATRAPYHPTTATAAALPEISAVRPLAGRMLPMRSSACLFLGALTLALSGCGGSKPASEKAVALAPVPDAYRVKLETSKGDVTIEVTKAWAPEAADRFYRLVERRFYDDARFFRVVRDFIVQFGINGDPAVEARWRNLTIADDPVKESNRRGTITFATSGPNSRTTQVFINLKDNVRLDRSGFVPFGQVVAGMDVVDHLYNTYGDAPPRGLGPDQNLIETQGNSYLESKFPRLDTIKRATIVPAAK
jgi:peptidyl-prolyl cis-trans isomerase A (cyclophilin A)